MRPRLALLLLLLAVPPAAARAAWDAFSDARQAPRFVLVGPEGLRLVLKGHAELGVFDLEGRGGEGHDSRTDTVTLGTRSATARLDGVAVGLRLLTPEGLAFLAELDLDDRGGRARGAWFDYHGQAGPLALHLEAGLNVPLVATDDLTYREPLNARIWWGRREAHLGAEAASRLGAVGLTVGLSAAVMRPLGGARVNDASPRGTVVVLGYGDAEGFSGNAPVYGARVALDVGDVARLEGFGHLGRLSAERGYDELRTRMAGFAALPGFDAEDPRDQDDRAWWAGGRADLRWAGAEARVEWIEARESLLRRRGAYAQVGYVWTRDPAPAAWLRTVEPRLRAERYSLLDAERAGRDGRPLRAVDPSQAITWDWSVLTASLSAQLYGEIVRLVVEHSLIAETNGVPAAGQPQRDLRNDETAALIELRF